MDTRRTRGHAWRLMVFVLGACCGLVAMRAWAQEPSTAAPTAVEAPKPPPTTGEIDEALQAFYGDVDTLWVMLAAFLVFFMQAGFALVEGGLTRSKNVVNIMMKNLLDFCSASVSFWVVGFGLMFGAGTGFMGTSGFFLQGDPGEVFGSLSWSNTSVDAKFLFQLVFAGTAATIVSGAMAERTKFGSYLLYSLLITAVIYPISGHWIWGGGWLSSYGFWDFAGSTVVHSAGGWLALCGAVVLGARTGKYGPEGRVNAIPGHSFPMMMLGVFILWLGWFGFNPGSTMGVKGQGSLIAHIAATTNIAAAAGTIGALLLSKMWFGKWDASMAGNGALAGLVGITAPCAWVDIWAAGLIGLVAGVLVVASVVFVDRKLRIDDPVGAISVHGVCGVWGTLAVGLFATTNGEASPMPGLFYGGGFGQLWKQLVGAGAVAAWCLGAGFAMFYGIKATMGLRVSKEEELRGLDVDEHGMEGYPDFGVRH